MRTLSHAEAAHVSGAGGLGLGLLAGVNLAVRPLLKVSIAAAVGVSLKGNNNKHCC